MKLIINKNQINSHPEQWLRQAGYAYHRDRRSGKDSFSRRLGSGFFPKLHMYLENRGDKIVFDLHLDQKQASYAGARMHNADHDSEVVAGEITRLKGLLIMNQKNNKDVQEHNNSLDKTLAGEYDKKAKPEVKKTWWRKFF